MATTSEVSLESAFSDLALARLRDKSSALIDYLLGFQMLKSEEDGSKAVGIFGFEVDGDIYYSPVFFLNGEVKGPDSIYSVNSDLFVPITEDWINDLIHREAPRIGSTSTKSDAQRGVRSPNYTRLNQIPGGLHKISACMMADRTNPDLPSFADAVKGLKLAGWLIDVMDRHPKFAEAIQRHYDLLDFADSSRPEQKVAAEKKVILVSSVAQEGVDQLTDEQREEILGGGVAVIDKRPEVTKSILYSTETTRALTNPDGGGLYDVVMSDGSVQALIVAHVNGPQDRVFVVDPDSGRNGYVTKQNVYTIRKYSEGEYRKQLEKAGKKLSAVVPNDVVAFVSVSGEVTPVFRVLNVVEGLDGHTTLKVEQGWYPAKGGSISFVNHGPLPHDEPRLQSAPWNYDTAEYRTGEVIVQKEGGKTARFYRNRLVIGDQHFFAVVVDKMTPREACEPICCEETRTEKYFADPDFGDHQTIMVQLEKIAAPLKVWRDSSTINIRDQYGTKSLGKTAALQYLLEQHGLNAHDAKFVVKTASVDPQNFRVKYAAEIPQMPDLYDTSSGGGFMSAFTPEQVPISATSKATTPDNSMFYRYTSPFGGGIDEINTVDAVDQASQLGSKEVFDAAALNSLIKHHNPTDLVDRYLPTMVAGMDKLGRLLFLVHWHYEEFEERYGEEDLVEFIDSLRENFNSLGETVMFIKQRSLSDDKDFFGLGVADTKAPTE